MGIWWFTKKDSPWIFRKNPKNTTVDLLAFCVCLQGGLNSDLHLFETWDITSTSWKHSTIETRNFGEEDYSFTIFPEIFGIKLANG